MLLMGQDLAAVLTKWVVAFYVACMDIRAHGHPCARVPL